MKAVESIILAILVGAVIFLIFWLGFTIAKLKYAPCNQFDLSDAPERCLQFKNE